MKHPKFAASEFIKTPPIPNHLDFPIANNGPNLWLLGAGPSPELPTGKKKNHVFLGFK